MSETGVNYGIVGASRSPDGYAGYYYNNGGGTALYAKAIAETGMAYGIHGESEADEGRGVYGEASNPAGGVGVEGSSIPGSGVYGRSETGYGVYGVSDSYFAVVGDTSASSRNYGLYTADNLYSGNIHSMAARMQIVQNGGVEPLEPGDVVAFSGIGAPMEAGGLPTIQVVKATVANSTAVAGVVSSRYSIEAATATTEQVHSVDYVEVTPAGSVSPGEHMLVVVQGPAQVKASALVGSIQPGDLLSSAGRAGYAAKAAKVTFGEVRIAMPGTVLGKVLEPLDKGEGLIYIFVTLQ